MQRTGRNKLNGSRGRIRHLHKIIQVPRIGDIIQPERRRRSLCENSMGALKDMWRNPHLDVYSKYILFRAIPMNLLLWGCKMWSMRQTLLSKLEVFMHRSLRRILDMISMSQVTE